MEGNFCPSVRRRRDIHGGMQCGLGKSFGGPHLARRAFTREGQAEKGGGGDMGS